MNLYYHSRYRLGTAIALLTLAAGGLAGADSLTPADAASPAVRTFVVTNRLLNFPVKNGALARRVTVKAGDRILEDFKITLADGAPDWWAFMDVSAHQGRTITVAVDNAPAGSTGLSSVRLANDIVGATNLYHEAIRPQVHFSARRGWLNDANGLFYYQGRFHLYYQHDPYSWSGNDQKYWGHAVSPDLIHWTELPEGIIPHAYGDWVWSGSALVDWHNTSGFKSGTNDVIVAAYYSTARGECMAYSNDGGLTFTDYTNNPVVVHASVGRDPKLLWYAPSNHWVMVAYDETGGGNMSFYTSANLRQWTYQSRVPGFFECPDLIQLPVDGRTNDLKWVLSDASGGYMIGQFDGRVFTPETGKLPNNCGSGFYAAQTFTEMPPGDHRTIQIGWAQMDMPGMPFNQMLYFPTELTLQTLPEGIRLCTRPVREITNAIARTYAWTNLTVAAGQNPLADLRGQLFYVQAEFTPEPGQTITFDLCGVPVHYFSDMQQIHCGNLTRPLPPVNGTVKLEMITDRRSVEIFGNNGRLYMPVRETSYSATNDTLSLISRKTNPNVSRGDNTTFKSLKVSELKPIWPKD